MRNPIRSAMFAVAPMSLAAPTLAQTAAAPSPAAEKQQDRAEFKENAVADGKQDQTNYQARLKAYHEKRGAVYAKKEKSYRAQQAKRQAAYTERLDENHEKKTGTAEAPKR